MPAKPIKREIEKGRTKLENAGYGARGKVSHTQRRIRRELKDLAKRSPGFAPVRVHSEFVKRLGNSVAKALQAHGVKVDRGLVNQASLAHDSRRDFTEQDKEAQSIWARRGAPAVASVIGTGESWTLRNYRHWPLEKKIVAWGDNICRGVKVGSTFVNGIVPSETAYKLLVSQRQAYPERVDALTRERQAVVRFENELRQIGLDPDAIVRGQMKHNPKSFLPEVEKAIDPKVNEIIAASMKRLRIKKLQ
ncbi:MAG: hypothetical protein JW772_02285 [Candidatus Diapherotrites archaeon]|nr:hypothetical protein [Candidatus Diapherotrites archaeon]